MDNEAFEVSEDAAVLSEGAGRKVIPFTRFLSTKSEGDVGDKFKIQKKVSNILLHRNEYMLKPVYFYGLEASTHQRNPRISYRGQSEQQNLGRERSLTGLPE